MTAIDAVRSTLRANDFTVDQSYSDSANGLSLYVFSSVSIIHDSSRRNSADDPSYINAMGVPNQIFFNTLN